MYSSIKTPSTRATSTLTFFYATECANGWNCDLAGIMNPVNSTSLHIPVLSGSKRASASMAQNFASPAPRVGAPDSSLIIVGTTPTSGESNDTDLSFEYTFGWKLPNKLELEGQLRHFQLAEEEDHFSEWAPSIVLKAPLMCGRAKAHIEYFGLFSRDREEDYRQHYIGPGIHFLITPNIEIGTRVFWGLGGDSAEFFCLSGAGIRF